MTLQDIYSKEGDFDDEDDSDWEPLERHIPVVKWFCVNCTMVNIDDAIYCHVWSCQLLLWCTYLSPILIPYINLTQDAFYISCSSSLASNTF